MGRFCFKAIQLILVGLITVPIAGRADFRDGSCAGDLLGIGGIQSRKEDVSDRIERLRKMAVAKRVIDFGAVQTLLATLSTAVGEDVSGQSYYRRLQTVLPVHPQSESGLIVNKIIGGASVGKSTLLNRMIQSTTGASEFEPDHEVAETGIRTPVTVRPTIAMSRMLSELGRTPLLQDAYARYPVTDSGSPHAPIFTWRPEMDEITNLAFVDMPPLNIGDRLGLKFSDPRAALKFADVLFVMFDDNDFDRYALLETLTDLFKHHGHRPVVLVMRADIQDSEDLLLIKEKFDHLTEILFGVGPQERPEDRRNAQEGVLGMYVMPYDSDVRTKKIHPEMIALDTSLPFDTLIQSISAGSLLIRSFPVRAAGRIVHAEIKNSIRQLFRKHYLIQIYGRIAQGALELPPESEPFPFDDLNMLLLRLFAKQRNQFARVMSAAEGAGIHVIRLIPWLKTTEPDLDQLNGDFTARIKRSWIAHLERVKTQLNQGKMRVSPGAAEEIKAMIRHYNRIFPEARLPEAYDGGLDGQVVSVPNLDGIQLSPEEDPRPLVLRRLNQSIDAVRAADDETARPVQLTENFIRQGIDAYLRGEYKNGLRQTHLKRSGLKLIVPALTAGLVKTAEAVLLKGCIRAAGGVGACVVNAGMYYTWEARLLRELKLNLNGWLDDQQKEAFVRLNGELHLNGVIDKTQDVAIDLVRTALDVLGVETELTYPMYLDRQ